MDRRIFLQRELASTRVVHAAVGLLAVFMIFSIGCDILPGDFEGDITVNQLPKVEFANVPAESDTFSFAPVIYWKGRDADGFVEYYEYADIIDATALDDPTYFVPFIPEEAWVRTEATSDTVYLLTEAGEVTEHVFYVKCVDDRDAESEVIHRRFNRTNDPPEVPKMKWFTEPDTSFGHDIPHPDKLWETLHDTLYCLDRIVDTWQGLGFNWKSEDPDDTDLYAIPLQYKWYLEKVPHDTVWEWVSTDWSSTQEIKFFGLETGHYTFTVWVRDDGFELSERPASATFDVYSPTFNQSILLLNTTKMDASPSLLKWIPESSAPIGELYRELTSSYPDVQYLEYDGDLPLYKSFLGRFRLVIWFSEHQTTTIGPMFRESDIVDYVNVGGRLWVLGFMTRQNMISPLTMNLTNSQYAGPSAGVIVPTGNRAELSKALSGVSDLPDLTIDTSKTGQIFRQSFVDPRNQSRFIYGVYPLLPGVDIFTTGAGAETAYYFSSYTDTANGDVVNEFADVMANADTINYPPTATDCIIALRRNRVSDITRVWNVTRGVMGTPVSWTNNIIVGTDRLCVARVSYSEGEPWSVSDEIVVDYTYLPFSDFHMKPCAIRYETIAPTMGEGFEVLNRVAVFSFPIYYFDDRNNDVTNMFRSMLNWFFQPYAH